MGTTNMDDIRPTDEGYKEAVEYLLERTPRGTPIYYTMRRVSDSGMTRWWDFYIIHNDYPHDLICITHWVSQVCELTQDGKWNHAAKVRGAQTDTGYGTILDLGSWMYQDDRAFLPRRF